MDDRRAAPPGLDQPIALFLDFDGTLVELAERPDLIVVPDDLHALLGALLRNLDGAVAIVTGRPLAAVDAYLAPLQLPGAGLHGVELRRAGGGDIAAAVELDLRAAVARLRGHFCGGDAADPGAILIEDKGAAVAVHYRQQPHRAAEVERALSDAVEGLPMTIIAGKFVFEARPRDVSKGSALRALMNSPPFAQRVPVFVGDDATDEDGIAAAQALGGVGIKVGKGGSGARARLSNPAAVRAWLAQLLPVR